MTTTTKAGVPVFGLGTIHNVIDEMGRDYVYENAGKGNACVYFNDDGTPGCIIGHALDRLGFGSSHVLEGESAYDVLSKLVNQNLLKLAEEEELDVLSVADRLQDNQDGGIPWGEALDEAIDYEAA